MHREKEKEEYYIVNGGALRYYAGFSFLGITLVLIGAFALLPWLVAFGAAALCLAIIINVCHADMLHLVVFSQGGVVLCAGKQPLLSLAWEQITRAQVRPKGRHLQICILAAGESILFYSTTKQFGNIESYLLHNGIKIIKNFGK